GATALIARSSACLWLAAVAQLCWYVALLSESPGGLFGRYRVASDGPWAPEDWIFLAFSVVVIGTAVSRCTARSGPWTILIAALPLLWWMDNINGIPFAIGYAMAWSACGIAATVVLTHERWAADRSEAAASALIGSFAVGLAMLSLQGSGIVSELGFR